MNANIIKDRKTVEIYLRRDELFNVYGLGDLDDFFRPYTEWHAISDNDEIAALALIYKGPEPWTLLAYEKYPESVFTALARELVKSLPAKFYSHLSREAAAVLEKSHALTGHGRHYKMGLKNFRGPSGAGSFIVEKLGRPNLDELNEFYRESYPGNWFDPRMIDTGYYCCIRSNGRIACAAGVHVYSEKLGVAALGNIATNDEFRGRGMASAATAFLCGELLKTAPVIGLNVLAGNLPAIRCYEKIGFEVVGEYFEYMVEKTEAKCVTI